MKLQDKVAVITGAGSGMGAAMARLFAAEGARVVAAEILPDRLETIVSEVRRSGGTITGVAANVGVATDVERTIQEAVTTYGRLDVLCNNAGIMDRMLPVAETDEATWQRVLTVNLTGPFLASRAAIPIMLRQGGGVIINTASVGGLQGGRAGAAYTASKHGVVGLTKNVAWTYGEQGIRCVAICPGAVETNIGVGGEPSALGMARMQKAFGTMPRVAKPEEIARVALFLASDDASYVNGAAIVVDGGWTAY